LNIYQSNLEKNSVSSKYFEINTVFDKGKHEKYENIPNQLYTLGVLTPSRVTNVDLRGEDKSFDIYYVKNLISTLIGEFNVKYLHKPGFHKRLSFLILKNGKQVGFFGQLSYELMDDLNLEDPIYLMELNIEKIDNTTKETNDFIP
jgi:Phenylalanyl-tRNA synthetase beta subunit